MHILVLGGTGNTGREVVRDALRRGHHVRALVRNAAGLAPAPGLEIVEGDVLDPADLGRACAGVAAILCCLGIRKKDPADPFTALLSPEDFMERCARAIVAAMQTAGVPRAIFISSAGVNDSWDSVDPDLRAMIERSTVGTIFRDLGQMERVLEQSGQETLAVRPVMLVNGPATGTAEIVARFEKTSRITTGDVALWMLDALARPVPFADRTEMIGSPPAT